MTPRAFVHLARAAAGAIFGAALGAVLGLPATAQQRAPADFSESAALLDRACAAQYGDADRCACQRRVFLDNMAAADADPTHAMVYVVMRSMAAIGPHEAQQRLSGLSGEAMRGGTELLTAAPDPETVCEELAASQRLAAAAEASSTATPLERYVALCGADSAGDADTPATCRCVGETLRDRLDPPVFELMVDLQAAEARGEDAMTAVAAARGLSEHEMRVAMREVMPLMQQTMMDTDSFLACAR